jgi:6-pyruvoyltetrahydropterin/6-carboxytetrahydropterin synthase
MMNATNRSFELSQEFYFEAAHTLERNYETLGSLRIHGHTYESIIGVSGPLDSKTGMIVDLAFLRKEINRVRTLLDHQFLDEITDLGPATLENLCLFIEKNLTKSLPQLSYITVARKASGDKCTLKINHQSL